MTWVTIGLSAGTLLGMAVVLTSILGWANKKFHVDVDTRALAIIDELPGANCGGCGYVGCGEYAEAVALEHEDVSLCTVGGPNCAQAVAGIMGVEVGALLPYRPIVHCGARYEDRLGRSEYRGEMRCAAANLVTDVQGCTYGCLGFGDCVRVCQFDALKVIDGLATVDYEKCVGCGACAKACPRNIITITPFKSDQMLAVTCSNKDKGKDVIAVCNVGCIGCGACARTSGLFTLENNLSTIDYDAYTPTCGLDVLEACKKCKRQRLVFVGKPTADDLEKVKDQELPELVEPDFKTTVDDMEWRG
ncbi:MAG: 4Fe-4S binding protein [Deltaproteobacteria bacterium]|nr:4Fe-4S binding protein [Deltaproteobacteria bacterium]MBW2176168.1 4Fe-4S binding protein [Deltaproteobacteria bacterium]MBW2298337.1 4Fe-4S binding protein [Deltaproteobacteria bacterium]MBW2610838.1 4Fe-4S binding protein [Deltaproteobacteria bacterium]MBW2676224.1 4Fe-4S binding protein [Deltaproteobacteria bacterium]